MRIVVVVAIWEGGHWEVIGSASESTDATVRRLNEIDPSPERILLRSIEVPTP